MVTYEEMSRCIDEAVTKCLQAAAVTEPPVDPLLVAEVLGIRAQRDAALSGRAERRSVNGQSLILVRPEERSERECFAVAHEISEALAVELILDRLGTQDASDLWREHLANLFAGSLLCPSAWLQEALPRVGDSLGALKVVFTTASHEVIARRLLSLEMPTVITIVDHTKVTARLGNTPVSRVMTAFEEQVWRQCHERVTEIDCRDGPLRIQALALHENGWKREILRTTAVDG